MKDYEIHRRFLNVAIFVVILIVALISLTLGYFNLDARIQVFTVLLLSALGILFLSSLQNFIQYLLEKNKKKQNRLVKLEDLNSRLMEKLAKEAPGTYSHSLIVAQLSVSVGKKLGLDPVLLRVASYYQDIGKLKHPNTYVENKKSPQDKTAQPSERDARTIVDHVSSGIKIARENKLPEEIVDFISQHHGTSSFYDIAYPGPKSLTRYSAILMIADGIEARVRAAKDPNDESIQKIIHDEITKRLKSDQLRLTGFQNSDIEKLEKMFFESAREVFHKRGARK